MPKGTYSCRYIVVPNGKDRVVISRSVPNGTDFRLYCYPKTCASRAEVRFSIVIQRYVKLGRILFVLLSTRVYQNGQHFVCIVIYTSVTKAQQYVCIVIQTSVTKGQHCVCIVIHTNVTKGQYCVCIVIQTCNKRTTLCLYCYPDKYNKKTTLCLYCYPDKYNKRTTLCLYCCPHKSDKILFVLIFEVCRNGQRFPDIFIQASVPKGTEF